MEIRLSRKARTFLALPVDEKYYAMIRDLQSDLMADLEYLPHSVNWTKKSRLHLTLFFLGEQTATSLQLLIAELTKMLQNSSPKKIQFHASQRQLFPTPKPTVIALTGDCLSPLRCLRENIGHCLESINVRPDLSHETEGFLPHITLGKLTEATDLKPEYCDVLVDFSQLMLLKSEQTSPCVVTHTPLYTWTLMT